MGVKYWRLVVFGNGGCHSSGNFAWRWAVCLATLAILATGCKPKAAADNETRPSSSGNYFATPFQTESEFIVQAVVADLAEQIFYAATRELPEPKKFQVTVTEKPGSPQDAPVYDVLVRLDAKRAEVKTEVPVNGPIWSPAVYQDVAERLATAAGLRDVPQEKSEDPGLVSALADISAQTILQENQKLSAALQDSFSSADLHERAALLLGAFMMRDHSGNFYEMRSSLSRMTAHLAMAHLLSNQGEGINGRMAEAVLLTLVGDEAPALEQLKTVGTNAGVMPMVRALQAKNTGDYRPLDNADNLTPLECLAWFGARASYISLNCAWPKLNDEQRMSIDFVRLAHEFNFSVEIGHQLLAASLPLEWREISEVYQQTHHGETLKGMDTLTDEAKKSNPLQVFFHSQPASSDLEQALNTLPEHCFQHDSKGRVQVQVIGWGQWAWFLQRQLCHAVERNFDFMQYRWGVPEDAREFATNCERNFGGLRLYPFVRRFVSTDDATYRQSVTDGFKLTVVTPHLVPVICWNYLCYKPGFTALYSPNPNPHVNEWHNHNPPPGTVYDLYPRLRHPSLTGRGDANEFFERLHKLAPYDCRIGEYIAKTKYQGRPDIDQTKALFEAVLPYGLGALKWMAYAYEKQPEQYEKYMLQAAQLDSSCYYTLADRAANQGLDDQAEEYLGKAVAGDADSVRVANHALWRVRYYVRKGQLDKAREIADFGGEVYSAIGLQAEGVYHEAIKDYAGALEWYAKEEERYDNSSQVIDFCLRYKGETGDTRFDGELQKRENRLFPGGVQHVTLKDFAAPPTDGVVLKQQSQLMTDAGLKAGAVIVAVYGIRVHDTLQYTYGRGLKDTPELNLIVWQDGAYREVKASPPNHLFGVDIGNYRTK